MKIRTAILTGLTCLMINAGLGSAAFAQPPHRYRYRYRDAYRNSYRSSYRNSWMAPRYADNGVWQAEQMVRQAYRDILHREPDPSGLQQYTDSIVYRGWSDAAVRRSLLNSDEYAQRFGGYRRGYWRYR